MAAFLRSPRREETRARLLEAAAEVFVEEGLEGASVEAVCARAGFTRGAFYSNFSTKEELFLALSARIYAERAAELDAQEAMLTPRLRERDGELTHEQVSSFINEFFTPSLPDAEWFMLETEYQLLRLRHPENTPELTDFISTFKESLDALVERVIAVSGRKLIIPVDRVIPIVGGLFERAMRISVISGNDAPEGLCELGDRVAELLFAITVPE